MIPDGKSYLLLCYCTDVLRSLAFRCREDKWNSLLMGLRELSLSSVTESFDKVVVSFKFILLSGITYWSAATVKRYAQKVSAQNAPRRLLESA